MNERSILLLAVGLAACGGFAPDQMPGHSSFLFGNVAVDPDTETAFVMDFDVVPDPHGGDTIRPLAVRAVRPDEEAAVTLHALAANESVQVTFAPGRVITTTTQRLDDPEDPEDVPAYSSVIRAFDAATLAPIGQVARDGMPIVTDQSSSRRWALAGDLAGGGAALVDLDTLTFYGLAASAPDNLRLAKQTDRIFGIVDFGEGGQLRAWDLASLVSDGFALGDDGTWAGATLDIALGADAFELGGLLVSPTDDTAFVALPGEPAHFALIDLATGDVADLPGELWSPAYSPDGSSIVGYMERSDVPDAPARLVTVDVATHEVEEIDLPFDDTPRYFLTRTGHEVVVAPASDDGESLVLVDLTDGTSSQIGGEGVHLGQFTSRTANGELWLLEDDDLYCLDLVAGGIERLPTDDFSPLSINILPIRDRLVMQADVGVVFYDPTAREATRTVPLR